MPEDDYGLLSEKVKEGLRGAKALQADVHPVLSKHPGVELEARRVIN